MSHWVETRTGRGAWLTFPCEPIYGYGGTSSPLELLLVYVSQSVDLEALGLL